MKKFFVLVLLVLSALSLASCGESKSTSSACDDYLSYVECTSKKAGVDDATLKATLDKTKEGWSKLEGKIKEQTCQEAVNVIKKAPVVEGCELK